jgi:hypothetical protein
MCRNHSPRQAVRLASARKALDGERRLFLRGATDTAVYLKALREIGVAAIDIGFERIAAESSLAEVCWFRGGYYWTPHQNSTKLKHPSARLLRFARNDDTCHCEFPTGLRPTRPG